MYTLQLCIVSVVFFFPVTNTCPHRYIQLALSPWEQDADSSTENSLLLTVFKFFDYTAKIKIKRRWITIVVTQTSSALQITQLKCFSWAPAKVWTRQPWCASKSHLGPLSFWLPKNALFPIQLPKSASIWGLGDLAGGKPMMSRKFSLLASWLEMMKRHCLSHLFLTFGAMSHFCTTGKDQIDLENVQSLEDRLWW